jgi:hypothetical protein
VRVFASAPTAAAASYLLEDKLKICNSTYGRSVKSAAAAAVQLYDRVPFVSAASAHIDAEALKLWRVTALSSRCVYVIVRCCFEFSYSSRFPLPKDSLLDMLIQQQREQVPASTLPNSCGRFLCISPHDLSNIPER